MLPSSSPAWKLDKILPRSRWPDLLFGAGWLLAFAAIFLSGLALAWQLVAAVLAVLVMLASRRRLRYVHAISINAQGCTLHLDNRTQINLVPPYRATALTGWVSLARQEGFTHHWYTLYRDQFTADEWRQLLVLLRWSR